MVEEMNRDKEAMLLFKDKDIATIEAMHDLLLDHGHSLDERALKESRELTNRMYESLKWSPENDTA
jgi:hypothetical protein